MISVVDLGAASSQLGFFYVTGAEVRWGAATSVAADAGGLKLLLSGLIPVIAVGALILAVTCLLVPLIYLIFDSWFSAVVNSVAALISRLSGCRSSSRYLPLANSESPKPPQWRRHIVLYLTVVFFTILSYIRINRPSVPYNHMSGTLPFVLWEALSPEEKVCRSSEQKPFPISELIREELWEPASGRYKGWNPGRVKLSTELEAEVAPQPKWAPETWPTGFGRWELKSNEPMDNSTYAESLAKSKCPGPLNIHNTYDPTLDPMRISNLDSDILEPVQKALADHKVPIKHVVLVEMESARKDVFPFKKDSYLHKMITESYGVSNDRERDELDAKLAALTPVAEQITGESSNFPQKALKSATNGPWKDPSGPDMGGINVIGAVTGSSLSFKSVLGSHCGVGPLPVDFMFETRAEIYQPCMMHILELFNQLKKERSVKSTAKDMRSAPWRSIFMQSITGEFDNQNDLNDQMGFNTSVVKENINTGYAKHYHSDMREINYFGCVFYLFLSYCVLIK